MTPETRRGWRKKPGIGYNRYGDDFLIDKRKPDEVGSVLVSMGVLVLVKKWQIIDDDEDFWQEDHSIPEREMDLEKSETEKREHKNLRILEWIYDLPAGEN